MVFANKNAMLCLKFRPPFLQSFEIFGALYVKAESFLKARFVHHISGILISFWHSLEEESLNAFFSSRCLVTLLCKADNMGIR